MTSLLPIWKTCVYFPHQVEGITWMLQKEMQGTLVSDPDGRSTTVYGGLQCDDMGVGKTIQTVATIANHRKSKTLILAPLAMVDSWASNCSRAGFRVFQLQQGIWYQTNPNDGFPMHFRNLRPNVYISNYDKMVHNTYAFRQQWDRIVLDEAHKIRNATGQVACAVRSLHAPIRWAVTGTPLVNSLKDVVSLLAFIGVPHTPTFSWNSHYMTILPNLLLHRSLDSLRSVIAGAPPTPEIIDAMLPFITPEEEEFYHGVQCVDETTSRQYVQDIMSSSQAFRLLLRLRQLSVHPQIYIEAKRREDSTYEREDWILPTTKFTYIMDTIIDDDNKRTHKYIIFCQFMEEMNLLYKELLTVVPTVLLYHGGMSQKERAEVLTESKESTTITVLLLQLQTGGVGLNLQEYDRIIFVSPWWTSALMDQAIARAVRMGQTEVVKVYHLKLISETKNTAIINIDATIRAKADEKRNMLEKIFMLCSKEQSIDCVEEDEMDE
jgi:SNF2 family DNA or RNA helicase